MSLSLELSLMPVSDLCTFHAGPPRSDLQMYAVLVQARSGDKVDEVGPICMSCLRDKQHMLVLQEPNLGGGKRVAAGRIRRLSKGQERDTIEQLGGRTQPGSGSVAGYKSDARVPGFLRAEDKFTFAQQYGLKLQDLMKVRGECTGLENPALFVDFKEKATGRTVDRWAVIPYSFFKNLVLAVLGQGRDGRDVTHNL